MTETMELVRGTRARVVADSISFSGHRVTTIEVTMHRFVLAELNTHRVFSRNSASSRAIPLSRQLARVREDTAFPSVWPAEQAGMQGGADLPDDVVEEAKGEWYAAIRDAADHAERLGQLGVHKSIANRLIEPGMWHTVVITSTAWSNFFALRCNPMAQPEIRVAAEAMKAAYDASAPREIDYGMWHLPYITRDDVTGVEEYLYSTIGQGNYGKTHVTRGLIKVSTSRVAAVSYVRQGEAREIEKDFNLYEKLTSADPMHASPMEHVATPDPDNAHEVVVRSFLDDVEIALTLPKYGNLLGWHQHRFDIEALRGYRAFD